MHCEICRRSMLRNYNQHQGAGIVRLTLPRDVVGIVANAYWRGDEMAYHQAKAENFVTVGLWSNFDEWLCTTCGTVGIEWSWEDGINEWFIGEHYQDYIGQLSVPEVVDLTEWYLQTQEVMIMREHEKHRILYNRSLMAILMATAMFTVVASISQGDWKLIAWAMTAFMLALRIFFLGE